jgi:hypothetical protein
MNKSLPLIAVVIALIGVCFWGYNQKLGLEKMEKQLEELRPETPALPETNSPALPPIATPAPVSNPGSDGVVIDDTWFKTMLVSAADFVGLKNVADKLRRDVDVNTVKIGEVEVLARNAHKRTEDLGNQVSELRGKVDGVTSAQAPLVLSSESLARAADGSAKLAGESRDLAQRALASISSKTNTPTLRVLSVSHEVKVKAHHGMWRRSEDTTVNLKIQVEDLLGNIDRSILNSAISSVTGSTFRAKDTTLSSGEITKIRVALKRHLDKEFPGRVGSVQVSP